MVLPKELRQRIWKEKRQMERYDACVASIPFVKEPHLVGETEDFAESVFASFPDPPPDKRFCFEMLGIVTGNSAVSIRYRSLCVNCEVI